MLYDKLNSYIQQLNGKRQCFRINTIRSVGDLDSNANNVKGTLNGTGGILSLIRICGERQKKTGQREEREVK